MSTEISLKAYVKQPNVQSFINDVLGSKATQFATNLVQVVNQSEMLKNADNASVLNSAIMATMLDLQLNPSLGHAYIVPFNNKQPDGSYKIMAQFMVGYKGLKQLAIRSGQFKTLETKKVFEGQYVEDDSFLGYHFEWKSKTSNKPVGFACRFELLNGFEKTFFMTNEEIHEHGKKYSKTYDNKYGQWSVNFDGMAQKTVTKLCLNSGEAPLSIQMQQALSVDQSVINNPETMDVDYIDADSEKKSETTLIEKPKFTEAEFELAFNSGADISLIESGYSTTPEIIEKYKQFVSSKNDSAKN